MRALAASLLLLLPLAILAIAQDQQEKQTKQGKQEKAQRVLPDPTNLKILKAKTGAEIGLIMRTFTAGLGVQCTFCHAVPNYASDENPKKIAARSMIELTAMVNAKFTDGKVMRVTCYTCHHGEAEPKTAPEPRPGQ
jgi:hypothetical protein